LVGDEYDEMITNRICVGKKVLYILDRGWDERNHMLQVEMVLCFRTWEPHDFHQIHFREVLTISGLVTIQA
jgi:hypothetical protein